MQTIPVMLMQPHYQRHSVFINVNRAHDHAMVYRQHNPKHVVTVRHKAIRDDQGYVVTVNDELGTYIGHLYHEDM